MRWREKGTLEDSHICFPDFQEAFITHYYRMYSCGIFTVNDQYHIRRQGGRPCLFLYVTEGTLILETEREISRIQKGDAALINGEKPHVYRCPDTCRFLFFHYSGKDSVEMTESLIRENGSAVFSLQGDPELSDLLIPTVRECLETEEAEPHALSVLIYRVFCALHMRCQGKKHMPLAVSQAMEYVRLHIREKITLADLAASVGFSPCYFSRLFTKTAGITPARYIWGEKIRFAKQILRSTNSSVSEIAESLGFSCEASFINAFRVRNGMSPNQYRRLPAFREEDADL